MLRNADGVGWGVSNFLEKSVTKVQGSMILALRGVGWGPISRKKALRNITLEWPLTSDTSRF